MAHGNQLNNDTLYHLGDVEDPLALRNFLLMLIQQVDLIIGNRHVDVDLNYIRVAPGASYVQSEAVQVADDLKALNDRVKALEARLVPVNN